MKLLLLFVGTALAFPQLVTKQGCPFGHDKRQSDPSLVGEIISTVEGEDIDGKQGPAPLDPLAPLEPVLGGLLPRDLVGTLLSPLTGILAGLDIPTPQTQGLALVPDVDHPYIAPGPTDVRGVCPTVRELFLRHRLLLTPPA